MSNIKTDKKHRVGNPVWMEGERGVITKITPTGFWAKFGSTEIEIVKVKESEDGKMQTP